MSLNNFDITYTSKKSEFTDNRNDENSSSGNSLTSKLSSKIDNTVSMNFKTSKNNKYLYRFTSSSDNETQKEVILNDDLNDCFDRFKNEKFDVRYNSFEKILTNEDDLRKEITVIDEKQETQSFTDKNYTFVVIDVTICIITIGPSVIGFWRGVWGLMDLYHEMINASLTAIFISVLTWLRCIRNLLAPPFYVNIDNYNRLFLFPTLFKRVSTKN
ncbi:hypothetical protein V1478_018633 [Vespula squamosa]|uniref:Uncharacterized protein n=1 Tax=Vespula squamosa TaxID=30214 RepID=A0ABD1ZTV8_VESSQ